MMIIIIISIIATLSVIRDTSGVVRTAEVRKSNSILQLPQGSRSHTPSVVFSLLFSRTEELLALKGIIYICWKVG